MAQEKNSEKEARCQTLYFLSCQQYSPEKYVTQSDR